MKRSITLLLALIMALALLAGCGTTETPTTAPSTTTPVSTTAVPTPTEEPSTTALPSTETPTPTPTPVTPTPTETPVEGYTFTEMIPAATEQKVHKALEELPAYATLVGSVTLPPIDDQGQIGSCQSESVTYMQLTNAVAQYLKSVGQLGDWKPSKDMNSCFSPKYTYQFGGASTTNIYLFLQDQGAVTYAEDPYAKSASGGSIYNKNGVLQTTSTKWPMSEGLMTSAMGVRISNYEQTFVTSNPTYTAAGKSGVNMTSTEGGQKMLWKIKEALASGNCVVTGGYPSAWQSIRLTAGTGNLGKRGDQVITFSTDNRNGGHNVTIVGYDDELEVTANGITMTGAFLVANSWGTSYGKNGYTWVMYDALNSVSDFESFELPSDLPAGSKRDWTFDQFCFIYWDSDLILEMPELYAEIGVSVADRDGFSVELVRTDANGQTVNFTPSIFAFRDMHERYDVEGYLNPEGIVNGPAADGCFAVNLEPLLKDLPDGASYEDYSYSFIFRSMSSDAQLTVKKITVKNKTGEVLRSLTLGEGEKVETSEKKTVTMSFKNELMPGFLSGKYTFVNVATGKYIAANSVVGITPGKSSAAQKFDITFNKETNTYNFARGDGFVLDFKDGAFDGGLVQFNKKLNTRTLEQDLHIAYFDDGSVAIFCIGEDGTSYALREYNGKLLACAVTELTDDFRFFVESSNNDFGRTNARVEDGKLIVFGKTSKKVESAHIVIVDAEGSVAAEADAAVSTRDYEISFDLPQAGDYLVKVLDTDGAWNGFAAIIHI